MSTDQLKISKTPVPCLPPKNYSTVSFILPIILLSPFIILKALILAIIFLYLYIHCFTSVYIFPNNRSLYIYFFFPTFQILTRTVLFILGFYNITIKDERKTKRDKAIIITNHISTLDFMVIWHKFGGVPLTKAELYHHPLLFIFPKFLQMIPVERDTKTGRSLAFEILKKKVEQIYPNEVDYNNLSITDKFINKINNECMSVLLNPEMTLTDGTNMIRFAKGAFRFKKPVSPFLIGYKGRNREVIMRVCETDIMSILDLLSCFYFKCEVKLLEEYKPNTEEQNDPILYASNTCNYMAKEYNCGVSNYTYKDVLIFYEGFVINKNTKKYYNIFASGYYPFEELKKRYNGLEYKTVIKIMKQYIKNNSNSLSLGLGSTGNEANDYLITELNKVYQIVIIL